MGEEAKIEEESKAWIKANRKDVINQFINGKESRGGDSKKISFFMAGSPGAGKTEISKAVTKYIKSELDLDFVRIDADEIKAMVPFYDGSKAYLFQTASSIGVEKVHDYVLKKEFDFILDSTFSNCSKQRSNIDRSLNRGRIVEVFYIVQDPILSWNLTQAREKKEGRRIDKEVFVNELFGARECVKTIKKIFGNRVTINIILKDYENSTLDANYDVKYDDIDSMTQIAYSKEELLNKLK